MGLQRFSFQLLRCSPLWRSLSRLPLWLCLLQSLCWRDFPSLEENWKMKWFCWCFGSFPTCRHLLQHRGPGAPGKPPISVCLRVALGHAAFHWPSAQLLQPGYKSDCWMDMGLRTKISTLLCPPAPLGYFEASLSLQLRSSIHPSCPRTWPWSLLHPHQARCVFAILYLGL